VTNDQPEPPDALSLRDAQIHQAVQLLMAGASTDQVAERLGVTRRTIERWRSTDTAKAVIAAADAEAYQRNARTIAAGAAGAARFLASVVADESQHVRYRILAASRLISAHMGFDLSELDFGHSGPTMADRERLSVELASTRARLLQRVIDTTSTEGVPPVQSGPADVDASVALRALR